MRDNPKNVPQGVAAGLRDVKLKDVCNHSYGTICAHRRRDRTTYDSKHDYPKEHPLP